VRQIWRTSNVKEIYALDAEESVVLGNTLGPGRGTSLDLANTKSNNEVCNDSVLGLTRAVRDHDTPAVRLRKLCTMTSISK
jgi:hypothetical protein